MKIYYEAKTGNYTCEYNDKVFKGKAKSLSHCLSIVGKRYYDEELK